MILISNNNSSCCLPITHKVLLSFIEDFSFFILNSLFFHFQISLFNITILYIYIYKPLYFWIYIYKFWLILIKGRFLYLAENALWKSIFRDEKEERGLRAGSESFYCMNKFIFDLSQGI